MGMQQLSITLPDEVVDLVRSKVASGEYASESDVIQDGLESLSRKDDAVEAWLLDSVAPAYDRLRANPESAVTADHVRARIQSLRNG